MNYASVSTRYLDDAVATASPAKLLTMLYDRLVLDLQRAENEQRSGNRPGAGPHLTHAQDIVGELLATLDVEAWDGARQLQSVYTFLLTEMVEANIAGDPERTAGCRGLVEPLRDAWQQAAHEVAVTSTPLEPLGATVPAVRGTLGELGVG